MVQSVDCPPRKWCKLVLLREQGCSYEEIWSQIGRNVPECGICKFLKRYKETISLQNQTGKCRKRWCYTMIRWKDDIILALCSFYYS